MGNGNFLYSYSNEIDKEEEDVKKKEFKENIHVYQNISMYVQNKRRIARILGKIPANTDIGEAGCAKW